MFQGALALFGVHALQEFSQEAINAARSQAQLEATLRSTGQYSPEYVKQLAEIAEKTEAATGTSDDLVREVERILTQFGVGSKDMERFIMLTLDMAAAMGTDAVSSAQRLGMILDGNADRIRGFTVQVDKSLPLTERLQSVFDQLNRQVGGNAIAAFNATPKGIIEFRLATEHLKEVLGGVYNLIAGPFFEALARGLTTTKQKWEEFNKEPGWFLSALRTIGGYLGTWAGGAVVNISFVAVSLTGLTLVMKTFLGLKNTIAAFWYAFSGLGVEAITIVEARYLLFTKNLGTMAISWTAAIGSLAVGWNAGRALGEIKIGGHTLNEYVQISALGWAWYFNVSVAYIKAFWAMAKNLFNEGLLALQSATLRGVLEIAKSWNQIPGVPKIDTTGFEQSLVSANNRLKTFGQEREKIISQFSNTVAAITDKHTQNVNDTLGKTAADNAKAQAAIDQARAQSAFSSELARIARDFSAKLLALSAQASRDNTAAVMKNEEALYQQGLLSFEQYMKARSASMRAQFSEDRAAINKEISVISEQLKLKTDELARAKTEGKVAETTELTRERDDLQLKLKQAQDELRKLGRDNAQATLAAQIQIRQHQRDLDAARAAGVINTNELRVSQIEADPFLTDKERVKELLPLLDEEIQKKQVLIDQLVQRRDENKDEQQRIDLQNQINAVLGEQLQLQTKLRSLADSQSVIGSLKRDWTDFYSSISGTSKNLADFVISPFKGLRDGLSEALDTLITKGGSFKSFFIGVGQSIEKSMIQSFSNMAADWVTTNVMMLLRWAATQLGITGLFAAHTATRTAIHTAGETAQTTATGTGASSRNAFRLIETIFHGAQVAVRVLAHVGGELAMSAASLLQSAVRRLATFLEAQPYIFLAAVKAATAVADIPYVGPILAPIAAAAVFAALEAMAAFKDGGIVDGPGNGTSDSIMARVSKGEFIIPAARVTGDMIPILEGIRQGAIRAQDLSGAIAPRMGILPVPVGGNAAGGANVNVQGHRVSIMTAHSRSEQVEFWRSAEGRKLFVELGRRHRLDIGIGT
ncbi:MAG TPA: hypothetical protein VHC44_06860 [Verrucomicrobiae bacterium]|nr:hypothetical protein [Verrucomicrobiae bacterium]